MIGGWIRFGCRDQAGGDAGGSAAGFVGIDPVVADGVLGFGGDVVDEGGEEINRFE